VEESPETLDPYIAALEAQCARMDREAQEEQAQRWGKIAGLAVAAGAAFLIGRKLFSRKSKES
jgi:nitrate reductase gamma subunit